MALMIEEVYTAFKEAGVSEETAKAAAKALSEHREELQVLREEMRLGFAEMKGMHKLHNWMLTLSIGLSVAIFLMLLKSHV